MYTVVNFELDVLLHRGQGDQSMKSIGDIGRGKVENSEDNMSRSRELLERTKIQKTMGAVTTVVQN